MKMSNTEIMKKISLLDEEKSELSSKEYDNNYINYATDVDKKVALDGNDYNYNDTTKRLNDIDNEIIDLKGKLAYANATVIVPGYNLTIGQCLVKLGQLNSAIKRYDRLRSNKQLSSTVYSTGAVAYCEYLYNVKDTQKIYNDLCDQKTKLQVAIDKINLLNEIDV